MIGMFSKPSEDGVRDLPYENFVWVTDARLSSMKLRHWFRNYWYTTIIVAAVCLVGIIAAICKFYFAMYKAERKWEKENDRNEKNKRVYKIELD